MNKVKTFALAISTILMVSCSSGSESDLSPSPNPNPDPNPVTITYTNTIKSIISTNCTSCHGSNPSNGANGSLDTYARVKASAENIIDRISRAQGAAGMMPQNGSRLPQSTIDKIIAWKNNGYIE
ncbi:MAG TPA: cytochrome c [Flavobacterium sp.]